MAALEAVEAIHMAAEEGDVEGVARMLNEDPRLLSSELAFQTLLTRVTLRGRVGMVQLLLERGADFDTPDAIGATALHHAASRGHEDVVSLLLISGADASRANSAGWTALINASARGHAAVVRLLLRYMGGRGLDVMSGNECTALWLACMYGHVDVVRALLRAGPDHTIASTHGGTPRQIAQERNHHECVTLIEVRPSVADASTHT
jgi:ankyrin repeat protein